MSSVSQSHLHGLVAVATEQGLDMKPVLFRVLTDLYIATENHSTDEIAQFRDIASALAEQVDPDTAMVVAHKLSSYVHTPPEVGRALIGRGDDASRLILADAVWLPRRMAVDIAAGGDRLLAAAVAARNDADGALVRLLLSRNDPIVDVTLAANDAVELPADAKDELLARGRDEEAIAAALLSRSDLTLADQAVLFQWADKTLRRAIVEDAVRLATLAGRLRHHRRATDELTAAVEAAAAASDPDMMATALAAAAGAPAGRVRRLLEDRSGECLAILLVAAGIDDETATRVFMFLDPAIGHSSQRVFALVDLARRVPFAAAERIAGAMMGVEGPQRAAGPRQAEARQEPARPGPGTVVSAQAAHQAALRRSQG
jgi:uncharacterized protein (DUF2336 family)